MRMIYDSAPDPFHAPDESGRKENMKANKMKSTMINSLRFPIAFSIPRPAFLLLASCRKQRENEKRYFFECSTEKCIVINFYYQNKYNF